MRRNVRVSTVHPGCRDSILNSYSLLQPTHRGHMAQVGLNTGAGHFCTLGQAKSIVKKLDNGERIIHDKDVIGTVPITWSLISLIMPAEILDEVDSALHGMPCLVVQDVNECKPPDNCCMCPGLTMLADPAV